MEPARPIGQYSKTARTAFNKSCRQLIRAVRGVLATTALFTVSSGLAGGTFGTIIYAGPGTVVGGFWGAIAGYLAGVLAGALGPPLFWLAGTISGLLLCVFMWPFLGPLALAPVVAGAAIGAWFTSEYGHAARGSTAGPVIWWLRRQVETTDGRLAPVWARWVSATVLLGSAALVEYLRLRQNVILW
jgi:hypothetical protein